MSLWLGRDVLYRREHRREMTPAESELLRARLKLWKFDYQAFAEQCLHIPAEDTRNIPFKFNRMQRYFWKLEQRCKEQGIPLWLIVLKIRRAGSSYYWTERLLWKALFNENRNGMIRAHDDDTTQVRSEEHTSELQSLAYLVCRLLLEK